MGGNINVVTPGRPKRVAIVASNPSVSKQTGWPIGFWWSELVHPYWEFVENGYQVEIFSPDGGTLEGDKWSDPRDDSKYSAYDLLSLGFISSPEHMKLVKSSRPVSEFRAADFDGLMLVGGQGPMYTFIDNQRLQGIVAEFYESGKVMAVVCHATCLLLRTKLSDGKLLVEGKTWTGFANSEEQFADDYVGKKLQPFWIEEEARRLPNTNFVVAGRFRPHAVRDGNLITGQQQYSGAAAARLLLEAVGL